MMAKVVIRVTRKGESYGVEPITVMGVTIGGEPAETTRELWLRMLDVDARLRAMVRRGHIKAENPRPPAADPKPEASE